MNSALRMSSGSADPFAKVKGLISDLIARLEKEAAAAAAHKSYCDKEFAETYASRDEKDAQISKLSTKIDHAKAQSALLKEEVATLQKELASLASYQAEIDKQRRAEKGTYDKNLPEMEQGLEGVKLGLKILREYFGKGGDAHVAAEGAAGDVIGLLEVVESDFTKLISEMTSNEEAAAAAYKKQTNENEVVAASKGQDVKYKTQEFTGLDKAVTELSADLAGVVEELAAVQEYLAKLKEMCIAKPGREVQDAGVHEYLDKLKEMC